MNYTNGDVLLLSTVDGGNINMTDGLIEMTSGFESAAFLSLFGGNDGDDGTDATNPLEFWGNKLDDDNPDRKLTSRTQNILKGYPATPANLNLVNQAIQLDLNWMKANNTVDEFIINLSIPQPKRINIDIEGRKNRSTVFNTEFEKNWIAQSQK